MPKTCQAGLEHFVNVPLIIKSETGADSASLIFLRIFVGMLFRPLALLLSVFMVRVISSGVNVSKLA